MDWSGGLSTVVEGDGLEWRVEYRSEGCLARAVNLPTLGGLCQW